jgi:hypothetical protein
VNHAIAIVGKCWARYLGQACTREYRFDPA